MTTRKVVIRGLTDTVERAIRSLHLRAYQALTSATPVDTGFARAGWAPSTGAPDRSGPAQAASREQAETLASSLFGQRSAQAQAIASGYRLNLGPVYLVNNVRYMVFLNQGSSAQAPANFVQAAIRQAILATQREVRAR